jgi:hypothetical protein
VTTQTGPGAEPPLLRETDPDLIAELICLLDADGHHDLGILARDLRVIALCGCGDSFCQSFYTAPPPGGPYGPGHRNVVLTPERGMLVLDVVDGQIMFVEVLYRPPRPEVPRADSGTFTTTSAQAPLSHEHSSPCGRRARIRTKFGTPQR